MSDKKPVLDQFFDPFLKIQQNAVEIIHYKTPKNKYFGDYLTIFANFNAGPLNREKFLEQVVPLVTIASNNGFEFLWSQKFLPNFSVRTPVSEGVFIKQPHLVLGIAAYPVSFQFLSYAGNTSGYFTIPGKMMVWLQTLIQN